jgi:hypothetical protein
VDGLGAASPWLFVNITIVSAGFAALKTTPLPGWGDMAIFPSMASFASPGTYCNNFSMGQALCARYGGNITSPISAEDLASHWDTGGLKGLGNAFFFLDAAFDASARCRRSYEDPALDFCYFMQQAFVSDGKAPFDEGYAALAFWDIPVRNGQYPRPFGNGGNF